MINAKFLAGVYTSIINNKKANKGITLIALIITIILLLILAGITINSLMGENGLITRAKKAKEETEIAEVLEKIETIRMEAYKENALENQEILLYMQQELKKDYQAEYVEKPGENYIKLTDKKGYVFKVTDANAKYIGKNANIPETVAIVNNDRYDSIQKAIDSTNDGTVQVIKNQTEEIVIPNVKNIKLDIKTNTLNGSIKNEGRLEILSGNIEYSGNLGNLILNSGYLEVSGGKLSTNNVYTINNLEGGKLKITGGTIYNVTSGNPGKNYCVNIHNCPNSELEITGGNIISEGTGIANIFNYGKLSITGGKIEATENDNNIYNAQRGNYVTETIINGGTIETTDCKVNINNQVGNLKIENGTLTSVGIEYAMLYNFDGTITIEGGNLTNKNDKTVLYNTATSSVANIKGGNLVSAGDVVGNETTLNVSGGRLESTTGGYYIINNKGTVNVTGGTFIGQKGY